MYMSELHMEETKYILEIVNRTAHNNVKTSQAHYVQTDKHLAGSNVFIILCLFQL